LKRIYMRVFWSSSEGRGSNPLPDKHFLFLLIYSFHSRSL
jgi:hypothetical protein